MATVDTAVARPPRTRQTQPRTGWLLAVLVVSAMVMILNETILSVALPSITADFGVGPDVVQWLTTGFMLTMAVVIPMTGFLLQRFTTRQIFLTAIIFFLVGTVLGALAGSFAVLFTARVIQAIGTALIMPLLMTVTLTVVAPEKRGLMMGVNSVVISVAPAIGPTLSGVILNAATWHWLFWAMVPVAALCLVVGAVVLTNVSEPRDTPFDVLSVVLSALAFGGIVYGLSTVGTLIDATSFLPAYAFVGGVVFLALFIHRQIMLGHRGRALLDLRPFTVRNFAVAVVVVMMAMGMMLGTVMVLPIFLHASLGVTALATGLVLLPGGLIQGILSPVIGRIYDHVGPRPLAVPGAILMSAAMWWQWFVYTADTSVWTVVAANVTFGIGVALVMTPLMTVSLASLPRELYGHGSAIMNTLQQLGGAMGTAVLIAAMTVGATIEAPLIDAQAYGASTAFPAGGVLSLVAVAAVGLVAPLPNTAIIEDTDPR